jgi:hypothetical protein
MIKCRDVAAVGRKHRQKNEYCKGNFELFFPTNFKLNIKVELTLEQAMKFQKGSRGIALLFL